MAETATQLQDCVIITQAFEKGATYNADEASVFATLSRNNQNTASFANHTQNVLGSYQNQGSLSVSNAVGATATDTSSFAGMKIGNQYLTVPTGKSGSILARAVKDCIPCNLRLIHNIDLNPVSGLLNALKADVKNRLNILNSLQDLLSNIDIYGDFCQMMSFLNFMCVPDLQRMVVILMAMMNDFSTSLLKVSGLLQALLAPFFTPVLMSLNSLLDQLVQLVLSPLTCIITSIEQNITKLDVGSLVGDTTLTSAKQNINAAASGTVLSLRQFQGSTRSALMQLHSQLNSGNTLIRNKLAFYTQELAQLLGQWNTHDTTTLGLANQKVINLRLIGLIRAMIQAKGRATALCADNQKPSTTELDNFFSTFVSPNSPFNISVDPNGNLRISEKQTTPIGKNINATPLLTAPATVRIIKCAIATTSDDVDKVNAWIASLNTTT